jgi:hypothetical protein
MMINTIANTATEIGFAKLTVHPAQAILLGGIFVCLLCYNKTGLNVQLLGSLCHLSKVSLLGFSFDPSLVRY